MRMSASELARYRDMLGIVSDDAFRYARARMDEFARRNPTASASAMAQEAVDALLEADMMFGEAAKALSCGLYDEVCEADGIPTKQAEIYDTTDFAKVESYVAWQASRFAKGAIDAAAFAKAAGDEASFLARRSAGDNMTRNCAENGVRYARVPSGFETCGFCLMLASRGFVYHSEGSAAANHGVHRNCDCVIVPGTPGVTEIEGYDPDALYRLYESARADAGTGATPWDITKQIERIATANS